MKIKIATLDCSEEQALCDKYDIQGYPTINAFHNGDVAHYGGARKADSIVKFLKDLYNSKEPDKPLITTLTIDTFAQVVNRENKVLVDFKTDWCSYCKILGTN